MRKITIIGAGQSGLQLGIGLVQQGYAVRLVSNRTPDDVYSGRVMSSQCMFDDALQAERDLGINFWEEDCPDIRCTEFIMTRADGSKKLDWIYPLDAKGQAVDQRVKIPGWMEHFEKIGGEMVIADAGVEELETYAADSDLVVVASGKGEIGKLFERDPARSPYDRPMRALALTYVTGMTEAQPPRVSFNVFPDIGEYFVFPSLTTTGACDIMVFEGVVGGPMDCWGDVKTPAEHLRRSVEILERFFPWQADRCRNVELTDANGILTGRFPPTVRHPVAELPSGAIVLGMADTVVLNDPITGQGSNNAAKCARSYFQSILERGSAPFDCDWMRRTFERYWDYAHTSTGYTNTLLESPPDHVIDLLTAAQDVEQVGRAFINGANDARDLYKWFSDPVACYDYIEAAQHGAPARPDHRRIREVMSSS